MNIKMSLSVMFETFLWILGDLPFLRFDKRNPKKIIEMDTIGFSCMKHDLVLTSGVLQLDVKLLNPIGNLDFKIKSRSKITVLDFVEIVNKHANKHFDTIDMDIVVDEVCLKDGHIVILTHIHNV